MKRLFIIIFAAVSVCAGDYFGIEVVDEATGRGVPLVELRTVNGVRFWTDSNGIVAFHEPGLMNREVWFHVRSDGYEFPKDGFGNAGVRLRPRAGASHKIKIKRTNIAERLYRTTGEGIYRDSILIGRPAPIKFPALNGEVAGQDTVIVTDYRGKRYWFWGDTDRIAYPLGNYAVSGATSEIPGLDPALGVDFTYFTNKEGFSRAMCPDFGKGLHWIESVFTLKDPAGRERMVARVSSQDGLKPAYAWHFAVWNDDKEHFESLLKWDLNQSHDSSHPFKRGGYIYLYPNYRVKEDWHSVTNLASYEAYALDGKWVAGAPRTRMDDWISLKEAGSGKEVKVGRGSVFWNEFRKRWILIGWVYSGEVWYSEAPEPTGPWERAVKVMEHPNYTFYNPTQHPFFDQQGGRFIYFEGTYTAEFSAAKEKTPRYNYNQIMYRLDLSDPRLKLE